MVDERLVSCQAKREAVVATLDVAIHDTSALKRSMHARPSIFASKWEFVVYLEYKERLRARF